MSQQRNQKSRGTRPRGQGPVPAAVRKRKQGPPADSPAAGAGRAAGKYKGPPCVGCGHNHAYADCVWKDRDCFVCRQTGHRAAVCPEQRLPEGAGIPDYLDLIGMPAEEAAQHAEMMDDFIMYGRRADDENDESDGSEEEPSTTTVPAATKAKPADDDASDSWFTNDNKGTTFPVHNSIAWSSTVVDKIFRLWVTGPVATASAATSNYRFRRGPIPAFINALERMPKATVVLIYPYEWTADELDRVHALDHDVVVVKLAGPEDRVSHFNYVQWDARTVSFRLGEDSVEHTIRIRSSLQSYSPFKPIALGCLAVHDITRQTKHTAHADKRQINPLGKLYEGVHEFIQLEKYARDHIDAMYHDDGVFVLPRDLISAVAQNQMGLPIGKQTITNLTRTTAQKVRTLNFRATYQTELIGIVPYLALLEIIEKTEVNPTVHVLTKLSPPWWKFWRRDRVEEHNLNLTLGYSRLWSWRFLLGTLFTFFSMGLFVTSGALLGWVVTLSVLIMVAALAIAYNFATSQYNPLTRGVKYGVRAHNAVSSFIVSARRSADGVWNTVGTLKFTGDDGNIVSDTHARPYGVNAYCLADATQLVPELASANNAIHATQNRRLKGHEFCATDLWMRAAGILRYDVHGLFTGQQLPHLREHLTLPSFIEQMKNKSASYKHALLQTFRAKQPMKWTTMGLFIKDEPSPKAKPRWISNPSEWMKIMGAVPCDDIKHEMQHQFALDHDGLITFACGLNNAEVGEWFNRCNTQLEEISFITLDFGTFEGTQTVDAKAVEGLLCSMLCAPELREFYYMYYFANCQDGKLFCDPHEFAIKGAYREFFVLHYTRQGGRSSGRADTTIGNTALNIIVFILAILILCRKMHIQPSTARAFARAIFLGDDNGVCCVRSRARELSQYMADVSTALGFLPEIKVYEGPFGVDNPCRGEFCSQRFMKTATGWILGPKIGRILTRAYTVPAKYSIRDGRAVFSRQFNGYLNQVAKQNVITHATIPIIGAMARTVLKQHPHANGVKLEKEFNDWSKGADYDTAYVAALYDVSVDELEAAEEYVVRCVGSGNAPLLSENTTLRTIYALDVAIEVDLAHVDTDLWCPDATVPTCFTNDALPEPTDDGGMVIESTTSGVAEVLSVFGARYRSLNEDGSLDVSAATNEICALVYPDLSTAGGSYQLADPDSFAPNSRFSIATYYASLHDGSAPAHWTGGSLPKVSQGEEPTAPLAQVVIDIGVEPIPALAAAE